MAKQPVGSGLKRQISPAVAIIAIIAVIGIALLIGFRDTFLQGMGGSTYNATELGSKEEILSPADTKRVVNERLGVTLSHLPDYKGGGGLPILSVSSAAGGLQPGDVVTAVNGATIQGPGDMPTVAKVTYKIPVGEKMTIEIRRNGQAMTLQVPRLASTPSTGGPGGMGGSGQGMRGPR
jgi:S1-C subfamily serine protease